MAARSRAYPLRQLENLLLDHITQQGYELIEIPIIESADVFLTRAGDKIIDRMFTFEHQGRLLALRPEFTAAAARYYSTHFAGQTVRWQFAGVTFADDADEALPNFQQHSVGVELIGAAGTAAEVETVSLLVTSTQITRLQAWMLVSGHVGLQSHLLGQFGLDGRTARLLLAQRDALRDPRRGAAHVLEHLRQVMSFTEVPAASASAAADANSTQQMLDALLDSTQYGTTMGGRTRHEIAARVLQKRRRATDYAQVEAAAHFLAEWVAVQDDADAALSRISRFIAADDQMGHHLLEEWQQTIEQVQRQFPSLRLLIQPNLARNWEYYTGIVFGIQAADGEYVAGGGRYDELVSLLGGQRTPAAGFAFYLNRLLPRLDHLITNAAEG